MANAQVFEQGVEQGEQRGAEDRARKQAMSDELLHTKVNELAQDRLLLENKLTQLKDKDGKPLPGYDDAQKALEANYHDLRETLHPDTNPERSRSSATSSRTPCTSPSRCRLARW